MLAAEIPSKENDGLAEDGHSVVWKLKRGVKWHDGSRSRPMTWCSTGNMRGCPRPRRSRSPATRTSRSRRSTISPSASTSPKPTPFWADAFVGTYGMIIPKHLFADYIGAKSRDAPTNLNRWAPALTCSSTSSRATWCRQAQPGLPRAQPAVFRYAWKSRAAATRCRPRARCCRPANMTTPGTCRSKTRS